MQTLTTEQRNTLQAQIEGLSDGNLLARVGHIIKQLAGEAKPAIPADQIDNVREVLAMAQAECRKRGI